MEVSKWGGVIVELISNSISTNKLLLNDVDINESLTTKNIASENATINNSLTTSKITSNRIDINKLYIRNDSSYVFLMYDGRLYIDESVYLRNARFFFQNDTTYLFDTNATLYFSREQDNILHGTNTFKCVAHGFYNRSNGYALISTGFVLIPLGDTKKDWGVLLGFVINGINFDCIYYDGLISNGGASFSTTIPGNSGNNPLSPPIMGDIQMCNITKNIYKNRIDADTRYYASLFCYTHKMTLNNTSKAVYVACNTESSDFNIDVANLCVKFTDVLMKKA